MEHEDLPIPIFSSLAPARPSSSSSSSRSPFVSSAKPYPRSRSHSDASFFVSGLGLSRTVDLSRAVLSSTPRRRGVEVVACGVEKPRHGDGSAAAHCAIDDPIGDGVVVLSVSIGSVGAKPRLGRTPSPSGCCTRRATASSSPAAPGTMGSALATASNLSPWVITVGASDIDRAFRSPVTLRSGTVMTGAFNQTHGELMLCIKKEPLKRKRGRPSLYGPDGRIALALGHTSPPPVASALRGHMSPSGFSPSSAGMANSPASASSDAEVGSEAEDAAEPLPPPVELGEVTEDDLRAFDGSDPKKPLLMAIKSQIYDVFPKQYEIPPPPPRPIRSGS